MLASTEGATAAQSQMPCLVAVACGVTPSMNVLWQDKPIHETESSARPASELVLECALRLDHVAVCSPPTRRGVYLQQLGGVLGSHLLDVSDDLESIRASVEFLRVEHAGIDINLISPRVRIPHLAAFLGLQNQGGVLHIGVAVSSIAGALDACRQAGIETLAGRLSTLIAQGLISEGDPLRSLAQTGYAEEAGADGQGYLRQTFVFPWKMPGTPFIEFVERQTFYGYGEASSPLLLRALDLISR